MNNNLNKVTHWRTPVVAILVFLLPALVLLTNFGVGLCGFGFLIVALAAPRASRANLVRYWPQVRWVLLAFLANFLFWSACFLLRQEAPLSTLDKPSRMLFGAAAMLAVLAARPDRRVFWAGVVSGAVGGAVFVLYQRWGLGIERPGGLINAITFGDLLGCLGLLALVGAIDLRGSRHVVWPMLGALAGVLGALATGTRGIWLALPFAGLLLMKYSRFLQGRAVRLVVLAALALVMTAYFVPATGMRARVAEGISDVTSYSQGGTANSHMGIRFELWKGAAIMIGERPWLGREIGTYKAYMATLAQQGRVDPVVVPMEHLHNDALQVLVTGGVVGLLFWLATLIAPLVFFVRTLGDHRGASRQRVALSLAGMLVVVCYFSFGLTEVIFWSVRSSLFYALMIFVLMGLSLNAKEEDGK